MPKKEKKKDSAPAEFWLFELREFKDPSGNEAVRIGPYKTLREAKKEMIECMADAISWDLDIDAENLHHIKRQLRGDEPMPVTAEYRMISEIEGVSFTSKPTLRWAIIAVSRNGVYKPRSKSDPIPEWIPKEMIAACSTKAASRR